MVPKYPAPKGPKLMHGYTPLFGPEAWLSTIGKMRMSLASTSVLLVATFTDPHICLLPLSTFPLDS